MLVFYFLLTAQLVAVTHSSNYMSSNDASYTFRSIPDIISSILDMSPRNQRLQPEIEQIVTTAQTLCLLASDHTNTVSYLKSMRDCLHFIRSAIHATNGSKVRNTTSLDCDDCKAGITESSDWQPSWFMAKPDSWSYVPDDIWEWKDDVTNPQVS